MKKERVCIIISGGMDSTTLLYDVLKQGYDVHALSFDYNQRHVKELDKAGQTCKKLNVPHFRFDLDVLGSVANGSALTSNKVEVPEGHYHDKTMKLTVVPNRNMVMLGLAASYCITKNRRKLFYGAHTGDHEIYPDTRPEFVEAMKQALTVCDYKKIELVVPYLYIDKTEILAKGKRLGVDYGLTWTCYKGGALSCGKCGSCTERLEAFKMNEMTDPLNYEINVK